MKHVTISLFFLMLLSSLHAQYAEIHLWNEPVIVPGQDFYIDQVIDGRQNRDNIGMAKMPVINNYLPARFKGGLENDIFAFLRDNMYRFSNQEPILMRITFIHISESPGYRETGRAEMQAEFYKLDGNMAGKIFTANAYAEDVAKNVHYTHETRIRKVITDCLLQFSASDWKNVDPEWISIQDLKLQNADINNSTFPFHKALEKIPRNKIYQFNALKGTSSVGMQLQFMSYSDSLKSGHVIIPASFLVSANRFYQTASGPMGTKENIFEIYAGGVVPVLIKLSEQSFLNLQGGIGAGVVRESGSLDNMSSMYPYFMLLFDQSYMFISEKDEGLVFSLGVYEHFNTISWLDSDFGIKLTLGITSRK